MYCKVVAIFEDIATAQRAREDLIASGCREHEIDLADKASEASGRPSKKEKGLWDKIKEFFTPDEEGVYHEASRRGGIMVAVSAEESNAQKVQQVLWRHRPLNLESCMDDWRKRGWKGGFGTRGAEETKSTEERIPVTEEKLKVGKKTVDTGGVRIHKRVSERPVEQTVPLREEKVTVERRPADRPAESAAIEEGTVEVRGTREEPMVQKEPRVAEEVVIRKQASERQARVSDTVRKTEVEVEGNDDDYREDFRTRYASSGATYEKFLPAYRFGRQIAMDERYQGRDWSAIEPQIQRVYEERYPGMWVLHRDAIHYGYDRAFAHTGREAH